jgi:hypothetical protein
MAKKITYRIKIDTDAPRFQPNYPLRMSAPDGNEGVEMSSTSVTITGDNDQSLTSIKCTTSYQDLNSATIGGTTYGGKACWWYIKNVQPAGRHVPEGSTTTYYGASGSSTSGPAAQGTITDIIIADDGAQVIARLAPGEWMWFCSGDNTKLQAKTAAGSCKVEYMCFHMA